MKSVLLVSLLALSAQARPLSIVLDPGHGGSQDGAVGPSGMEKNLSLQICRKLAAALEETLHAKVTLTRTDDTLVHLSDRVAVANAAHPDLFVSIHANSMPTQKMRQRIEGLETFFNSASASDEEARSIADRENAEGAREKKPQNTGTLDFVLADLQRTETHGDSSRLAYAVHQALVKGSGATDRGVQQAPFFVLTGVDAPAILVEVGFVSHPEEAKKLFQPGYQELLARSITVGIAQFMRDIEKREGSQARGEKP